jgi:hypothetical protein
MKPVNDERSHSQGPQPPTHSATEILFYHLPFYMTANRTGSLYCVSHRTPHTSWAGGCSSNNLHIYSGDATLESWHDYKLPCLKFRRVFFSPSRRIPVFYPDQITTASFQIPSNFPAFGLQFDAMKAQIQTMPEEEPMHYPHSHCKFKC